MDRIRRELAKMREATAPSSFLLEDGSRFHYDPDNVWKIVFPHGFECMRADYDNKPRPPAPPLFKALCRARDRDAALTAMYPNWRTRPPMCAYDLHALVGEGVLVDKAFAPGFSPVGSEAGGGGEA